MEDCHREIYSRLRVIATMERKAWRQMWWKRREVKALSVVFSLHKTTEKVPKAEDSIGEGKSRFESSSGKHIQVAGWIRVCMKRCCGSRRDGDKEGRSRRPVIERISGNVSFKAPFFEVDTIFFEWGGPWPSSREIAERSHKFI
ncbi:hypothetical protein PM082_004538 [Marasmius tenuissimus]|nr:hypothetical protein PM082_004538 [Marasmius tenuissimus]